MSRPSWRPKRADAVIPHRRHRHRSAGRDVRSRRRPLREEARRVRRSFPAVSRGTRSVRARSSRGRQPASRARASSSPCRGSEKRSAPRREDAHRADPRACGRSRERSHGAPQEPVITVLYFAAVRDLVGMDEERIELPSSVKTIAELGGHLCKTARIAGRPPRARALRAERSVRDERRARRGR